MFGADVKGQALGWNNRILGSGSLPDRILDPPLGLTGEKRPCGVTSGHMYGSKDQQYQAALSLVPPCYCDYHIYDKLRGEDSYKAGFIRFVCVCQAIRYPGISCFYTTTIDEAGFLILWRQCVCLRLLSDHWAWKLEDALESVCASFLPKDLFAHKLVYNFSQF